jgi:hypothetical protein
LLRLEHITWGKGEAGNREISMVETNFNFLFSWPPHGGGLSKQQGNVVIPINKRGGPVLDLVTHFLISDRVFSHSVIKG